MDLRVDGECRPVERPVAVDELAAIVDQQQILYTDLLEAHPERIDPEVIEPLGVARGDVSRDSFIEPELAEQAERGSETLLAVPALVVNRREGRELRRGSIGRHRRWTRSR